LDAIVQKALAKIPEQRYQSCEEMRKAFQEHAAATAVLEAKKLDAQKPAPIEPLGTQLSPAPAPRPIIRKTEFDTATIPRSPRRSLWIGLAVCLILGAVVAGAWF